MKTHFVRIAALFAALFASSLFALPSKQAKLTVSGYQGGETALENFPLLVRISPERISGFRYDDCALDGSDISFALENGEILPHEIDTWVNGGESLVWVRLPALQGTETSFYFRWKDSGPAENISANVWSADYAGVWHMNGANGVTLDSTGHELHAVPKVVPTKGDESKLDTFSIGVSGKVGTARQTATSKTNEGGYLQIPNYDNLALGGTFAMSGWLYQTSSSGQPGLIGRKPAYNSTHGWEVELKGYTTAKVRGASAADNSTYGMTLHTKQNTWAHLVFVYNNTTVSVYTNGTFCGSRTIATPTDNGLPLFLGRRGKEDESAAYIRGYFDEFRLKDGVPCAEWIKAEYDSMEGANFITYAAAEDIAIGSVLIISGEPFRVGSPEPAYGTIDNLTPGQSLTLSQPSLEVPGEGTVTNYLKGWTLEKLDVVSGEKTLLRSSSDAEEAIDVCNYVHNSPAVMTWLWEARDQLGVKNFFLVENGGNHLKFSVDVTGIGYTASSATLKLRYGIIPDNFIWTHVADQAVEKGGVLEMTLPNTMPGIVYYVKAVLETNEDEPQVVETDVITIRADPSSAGDVSSPLENIVLESSSDDKLVVKGSLMSAAGGTLTVLVGDSPETITNVWTQLDGSILSTAGEFSLTLGDAEPGSSRYLAPGSKYYVLVMVETGDGEIFISSAQSVTIPPSTSWTYYETAKDSKGIGYGYITDGVWKLYAQRKANGATNLKVTGSGGRFYGNIPSPMNFTSVKDGIGVCYKVVTLGAITFRDVHKFLYDQRAMINEVIAPDCTEFEDNTGCIFNSCSSLTNVVLNAEFQKFLWRSFSYCSNLQSLSPRRLSSSVPGQLFYQCYKLAGKFEFDSCSQIGEKAFYECGQLEEIVAPNATSVQASSFYDCKKLKKVVLSPQIVQIGPSAFSGCSSLESDFVNQIAGRELKYFGSTDFKTMGSEFSGCSSLTSLVWDFANLATNVVNASCFSDCSSLEKVIFKKPVVEIRSKAFLGIKPGAEVYMPKEAPAVFEGLAVARSADGSPYPRIYLSGNEDAWLDVMRQKHHVILKDDFDNKSFSTTITVSCAHDERGWQAYADLMAKDTEVCDHETTGSGNQKKVSRVWTKKKGVIGFGLYHAGNNHSEYGFWIFRAPQKGFSISVR
ncbi:MAG: leucine-rich repeat protein [Kiritimatiellae bacterium]|nr:leucine-rich repeat protein [Kiritimatiellia bacterium]